MTDSNGATHVTSPNPPTTCDGTTDGNGKCDIVFVSSTAGKVTGNASVTLTLAGITIAPPAALMLAYLLSGFSPLFLVLAITSAPFSLIAAVIVVLFLLVYRRQWARKLRDRLASDGITADEVGFFLNELTSGEKRSLRDMEKRQPLLADAYRETLALRLNATRLAASARRELLLVERRINRARYLNAPDTSVLLDELGSEVDALTVAVLEIVPPSLGALTVIVIVEGVLPVGARLARVHVTLALVPLHVQPAPLALWKVTPAGSVSVTVTLLAVEGPALLALSV